MAAAAAAMVSWPQDWSGLCTLAPWVIIYYISLQGTGASEFEGSHALVMHSARSRGGPTSRAPALEHAYSTLTHSARNLSSLQLLPATLRTSSECGTIVQPTAAAPALGARCQVLRGAIAVGYEPHRARLCTGAPSRRLPLEGKGAVAAPHMHHLAILALYLGPGSTW